MSRKPLSEQITSIPITYADRHTDGYQEMVRQCAFFIKEGLAVMFPPNSDDDVYIRRVKKFIKKGSTFFLLVLPSLTKETKLPVGVFQLEPLEQGGRLRNVIVTKGLRGQGLLKPLMKEAERRIDEMKISPLFFSVVKMPLCNAYRKSSQRVTGITGLIADSHCGNHSNHPYETLAVWASKSKQSGSTEEKPTPPRFRRHSI